MLRDGIFRAILSDGQRGGDVGVFGVCDADDVGTLRDHRRDRALQNLQKRSAASGCRIEVVGGVLAGCGGGILVGQDLSVAKNRRNETLETVVGAGRSEVGRDFDCFAAGRVDEDTDAAGRTELAVEDAQKALMDDIGAGGHDGLIFYIGAEAAVIRIDKAILARIQAGVDEEDANILRRFAEVAATRIRRMIMMMLMESSTFETAASESASSAAETVGLLEMSASRSSVATSESSASAEAAFRSATTSATSEIIIDESTTA